MSTEQNKRGREVFSKYKRVFDFLSKVFKIFPLKLRIKMLSWSRRLGGKLGLGIRYILLRTIARSCGENVAIFPDVYLLHPQNLSIGNNVSIQPMCYIECGADENEGIMIGNDVSIAHGATVIAETHNYQDSIIPIRDQGITSKKVIIGDNVWIGAKASVLCGNTVHEGCIVGTGAVVTHSIEENGVACGVPAKVIRKR